MSETVQQTSAARAHNSRISGLEPAAAEAAPPASRRASGGGSVLHRDRRFFILLLLPGVVVSVATIFLPVLYAIGLSFYQANSFIDTPVFVGLDNYVRVLSDPGYWHAFFNGLIYAVATVVLQVVVGIAIALILHQPFRGRTIVRGLALTPYILPTVVAVFIWKWLLDPNYGLINAAAAFFGYPNIDWLGSPLLAWSSIIFVSVWHWTPFVTITFLAALQTVPEELYEAAKLDGAGPLQQLFFVTLPVLRPVLLVIILLRTIFMFNKFDIIWLMTSGGPLNATEHLPLLAYNKTFMEFDIGGGTAIATTSFIFLTAGMYVYLKLFPLEDRE
ncbi:multiple sugar transport system permease protein [Phyllobacterium trifolii]|uniref:Multiple sugar transport system permease protein n=1 Tax=Phyllobacterium trifolii TaxID=300193 RepID=A0A839UIL6_9HYPH|nr:sugar ABC transporter permease [Phyllobacterium trifolii]MBB3149613.1 multiple sugar transport system permease protein [Phyllobacterium trifolii]